MRAVIVFLGSAILVACSSVLDDPKAFRMIHPEDGWVRMSAPPTDSMAMIVASTRSEHIQELLKNPGYRATWFQRGSKDYLVYFQQYHRGDNNQCGDDAFEFIWRNAQWEVGDFNRIIVCG